MTTQTNVRERGYVNISDHGLIGNLHTAALVSLDGSIESYCVPNFDSPSIFARILDKDKGGHFSITPTNAFSPKQAYLPSSNVLATKFLSDCGVGVVTDFLPRLHKGSTKANLPWLVRRVEVIRGTVPFKMECAPAFDYARAPHTMEIIDDNSIPDEAQKKILFKSSAMFLDLRYIAESTMEDVPVPEVDMKVLDLQDLGHLGPSATADLDLLEGQAVTFILRCPPKEPPIPQAIPRTETAKEFGTSFEALIEGANKLRSRDDPVLTIKLVNNLLKETDSYWKSWIGKSTYQGNWREAVHRSALALKLLIYEPTGGLSRIPAFLTSHMPSSGAIVASPTFSLPEAIGGPRNWDYRYSWVRDSSFTLYALIRLGFTEEANAYLDFMLARIRDRNPDGSLRIMYTIHGGKEIDEIELDHLSGHKDSKPVRIGNGAANHLQLDIYGELMDFIYLSQKFARPLGYDVWLAVRDLVDYVIANCHRPDLSIWEVRDRERHFTYSKVMMWVAIDRGLRLAEKRQLPLGDRRQKWLGARDALYEEIQEKAWNSERGFYSQSYDDPDILDSAVLVMPLVFFCPASDPRFLSTLKQILRSPERGGLSSNSLVYRYDVRVSQDGVGGEEGTRSTYHQFNMAGTLWCIESLTRAGQYDPPLLQQAVKMFEDFLLFSNHLGLYTEEVSVAGEGLGNAVQGFSLVQLISAAFHLSRSLKGDRVGQASS